MRDLESMENALARLMPPAISEDGQRSMDEMLDELFGEDVAETPRKKTIWKFVVPSGIAAALAMVFAFPSSDHSTRNESIIARNDAPQMKLMGESDWIEEMTDEGWVSDPQGAAMQAVRVRVVEENTLRDEETGIVVHVSEPREELLLFPVNAF